jgi:hypothetical protein
LPPKNIVALTAVARARKKSRSRILFDAIERYQKEVYYNRAGDVIHLQDLIRHAKEYVSLAHMAVFLLGARTCGICPAPSVPLIYGLERHRSLHGTHATHARACIPEIRIR